MGGAFREVRISIEYADGSREAWVQFSKATRSARRYEGLNARSPPFDSGRLNNLTRWVSAVSYRYSGAMTRPERGNLGWLIGAVVCSDENRITAEARRLDVRRRPRLRWLVADTYQRRWQSNFNLNRSTHFQPGPQLVFCLSPQLTRHER